MSNSQQERATVTKLQELIDKAVRKIGATKENDICRYIPSNSGGYIHHFTMRKMKTENPQLLMDLIEKNILTSTNPPKVSPKPRAARGSRKRRDQFYFSKTDIERLLHMARISGDKDMVRKLTRPKDLRTIKRELITSIRQGKVDQDLWTSYAEAVGFQHAHAELVEA